MATTNKNLFPDLSNPNAEYYQVYKPTYSTTPSYSAPTSYNGQQSSLGNITGVSADKVNSAYTGFADSARASGTAGSGGQVNMYTAPGGNVYNTSNMTPQQINAMMLNKENNPNAAAILAGMGLDINGNQRVKSPWEQGLDRLRDGFAQRTGNSYNYQTGAYTSPTGSGSGSAYSVPQNGGYIPPASPPAMTASQTSGQPVSAAGVLSKLSGNQFSIPTGANGFRDQAIQQRNAERESILSAVEAAKANAQRNYGYTNQLNNDNRVLEDTSFQRNNNPFSGRTSYDKAQVARSRQIADTQTQGDFNANIASIQKQLTDFDLATPGIINSMVSQMEKEKAAAEQLAFENSIKERIQANSERDTNARITGLDQPFTQEIAQMNKNSDAWFNATPSERKRLEEANRTIARQIGAVQDDQGNWMMPSPQLTIEAQKEQVKNGQWSDEFDLKMREFADKSGLDWAKMDLETKKAIASIAIDQQNADSSRISANASASNAATNASQLDWARDPNNPDNIAKLRQGSTTTQKTTDYKTSPEFASDVSYLKSNPNAAAQLDSNAEAFISAYGYDGYLALRKAANLD